MNFKNAVGEEVSIIRRLVACKSIEELEKVKEELDERDQASCRFSLESSSGGVSISD